jgi:hypothetical protein
MRTVVFTSDNHSWLLKGFFHQWKKYGGGRDVEVAGFTPPSFLPENVKFTSIGRFEDYPVEKWSDAVIKYLQSIPDEYVLILLEDYWLMRPVNWEAIDTAFEYSMAQPVEWHDAVIRLDVAADRMFSKDAHYLLPWGNVDICKAKGDYSLSFQASIFNRKLLLEVMRPGETPWQSELKGSWRLNQLPYRVIGTYQWPMNYMISVCKGKLDTKGEWMYPARTLLTEDWRELEARGFLDQGGV